MTATLTIFLASIIAASLFLWRYVRLTLSLSSTSLGLLLLFHGPAYWYYTRQWSLGQGVLFNVYNQAWRHDGPDVRASSSQHFFSRMSAAVQDADIVSTMDIALALSMVLFCVGIWLADRALNHSLADHEAALNRWRNARLQPMARQTSRRLLSATGAAIVFMLFYMMRDGQLLKIYTFFTTQAGEFEKIAMRRSMGGSPSYLFNVMLGTLLPFIAFSLWAWGRGTGQSGVLWLAGLVTVLVTTAKLATLSKAPAAVFILQLLVLEMARRSLQVSPRQVAILLGVGVLLFSAMTFVANSDLGGMKQSLLFLFYRIFMIPNESLLEYFAAFPQHLAYTHGQDIRILAIIQGVEPLQPSFWRVAELHRGVPGAATTAMFMADAWAEFSWMGVFVVSLLFGFLLRYIDIQLITRSGRSAATIAGLGLGHYGIFTGLSTAFQTALLTGGLFLIVPVVALLQRQWPRPVAATSPGN